MPTCDYCTGPITGWRATRADRGPGRPPPVTYCCFGCLSLGEQRQQEAASRPLPGTGKSRWLGMRLGIGILVVGQSMIFGLALNLHDDVRRSGALARTDADSRRDVLVIALLGGPLAASRWQRTSPRPAHHRGALPAHHDRRDGRVAAGAHHRARQDLLRSRLGPARRLHARQGDRRASRAAALAGSRAWAGQLETCRLVDTTRAGREPCRSPRCGPATWSKCNPGETIAVDGVIREGVGFVSEAAGQRRAVRGGAPARRSRAGRSREPRCHIPHRGHRAGNRAAGRSPPRGGGGGA